MPSKWLIIALVGGVSISACGGADGKGPVVTPDGGTMGGPPKLLQPKPECSGASVAFRQGTATSLISKLDIAGFNEGFDFTGDGLADNILAPIGALANNQIKDAFTKGDIYVLFEWFDLDTHASLVGDDCVKTAVYLGKYHPDEDQDTFRAGGAQGDRGQTGKDCNDHDATIHPGAQEIPGDRVDNDCNGLADETTVPGGDGGTTARPSNDTMDQDGDGYSLKQGDCDDRPGMGAASHPMAQEICGDGLDNDCNGIADDGCNPYAGTTAQPVAIDPLSLDGAMPKIKFDNGLIAAGTYKAGPSLFSIQIPLDKDFNVDFRITGANVTGTVELRDGEVFMQDVLLGGVLDARTLDNIKGLEQSAINLNKDDSLLDLVFAGFVGKTGIVTLGKDADGHLQPDIDLDGDGIESFWDSNPDDDIDRVDTCKDGDGTIVMDTPDMPCTMAKTPDGHYRFVDGLSIALKFSAVPAKLGPVEPPAM